jgi:hypothetical protein
MGLLFAVLALQGHILLKVHLFAMYVKKEHIPLKDQFNVLLVPLGHIQIKVLPLVHYALQEHIL